MTKAELIELLTREQDHLDSQDVEMAVKTILEHMSRSLAAGERIEVRRFGSFCLHFRQPRMARNPRTGEPVAFAGKYVPHFRPGKELRDRVNAAAGAEIGVYPTGE